MQSELTGYYVLQGFLNVKSHLKFNFGFWFDFHLLKCTTVSLWKESKMRINQKQELAEIFTFTYYIDLLWSMKWNWGIVTKIMLWFRSLTDTTFHEMKKYIVNCANRIVAIAMFSKLTSPKYLTTGQDFLGLLKVHACISLFKLIKIQKCLIPHESFWKPWITW